MCDFDIRAPNGRSSVVQSSVTHVFSSLSATCPLTLRSLVLFRKNILHLLFSAQHNRYDLKVCFSL